MWAPDQPHRNAAHLGPVVPERVLYEFDEPLLFTAKLGLSDLLFLKVSHLDGNDLYLATSVYPHILEAVDSGVLSIRGAIESGPCFMVELTAQGKVARYWDCVPSEVPEKLLPQRSVGLIPGVEWVADTFDQIDAFFSVRFSGQHLLHDTMSFQTFKKLVDNFYESVRRMFAPTGLEKAKSTTFDFRIHEPAFGSLILTIDKPELHAGNIRRHLHRPDLDMKSVRDGFAFKKDEFFKEMIELVAVARVGELDAVTADRHIGVLSQVVNLLPGEATEFTKVEFNGRIGTDRRSVIIEEATGARLRRAHEVASGTHRTITGEITIVNSNSNTFVLRHAGGRQITCHLPAIDFEPLLRDPRFRSKSKVSVSGRFFSRSRRDFMELDARPNFA